MDREPVDIIMQTFNRLEFTRLTINGLYERTRYPFRLIVVDNASTDNTQQYLKELKQKNKIHHMILNRKNTGLMIPKRQAFAFVRSVYFLTADNDVIPPDLNPCWLTRLVGLMVANPDYGQLAPRGNGTRYPNEAELPEIIPQSMVANHLTLHRKKALDDIGGYPDLHIMRGQDSRISKAIKQKGWKIGRVKNLWVNHLSEGIKDAQANWGYDVSKDIHGHKNAKVPKYIPVDDKSCVPLDIL